ncbi:hypothetical protein ACWEO1_20420 [Kitasatospora cineracea]
MNALTYAAGLGLVALALAAIVVTPLFLAHARTAHDHGPTCWWCHPWLARRR